MAAIRATAFLACVLASACDGKPEYPEPARDATLDRVLTPVPEPFRNIWAVNLDDCPRPDGKTRISIDPASVSFPDGRFDVVGLNQPDRENLLIDVRLGGGPLQTHILHLSDALSILSYSGPGIMQTYHRCNV